MESLGVEGIAVIAFVLLCILLLVYSVVSHGKRKEKIQQEAGRLGLGQLTDDELAKRAGDLTDFLYPNGVACELREGEERRRHLLSIIGGWSKILDGLPVTIFDVSLGSRYYDRTAGGSNSLNRETSRGGMTLTQTVVLYGLEQRPLPRFIIAERLPEEADYVTVRGSTQLGEHYRCCALPTDRAQVEALFGDELLGLLESERLWSIESHGDRLIVYQKNWLTPANKFASLIDTADRVCTLHEL